MVHGALIGMAVTSGIVAITAFELGVFRPWREENWPEGIGEEIRREWHSVKEDVRQVLGGRDAWTARADARRRRRSSSSSSGSSTAHEDEELRHEVEEFELHEREVLRMRERMLREFGTTQHEQEHIASTSALQVQRGTDARQRHQAKISEHHARQAANLSASRARREQQNLRQQQQVSQGGAYMLRSPAHQPLNPTQQSTPVDIAPGAASRQSSVLFNRPTFDEPESPHHALGDDASSTTHSDTSPLLPQDATPPALPPKPQAYAASPPAGSSYATALAPSSYATAVSAQTVVPGRRRLSSSASSTNSHASDTSNLNMDRSRHTAAIHDIFSSFDELREERLAGSIGTLRSSESVKDDEAQHVERSTPRSSRAVSPAASPRTSPLPRSASLSTHDPLLGLSSPPFSAQDDEDDMHIVSPPASISGWTDARSTSHTAEDGTLMSRAPSSGSSTSAFSYAIPPSASSLGVRSSDAASSHAASDAEAFDDAASAAHDPFANSTLFSSAETQGQWRMPSAGSLGTLVQHDDARSSDEEWDQVSDVASGFPSPRTAIRSLRDEA